jgi:hypothetical protein
MTTPPIKLTTLGSRCVELHTAPAALTPGGIQIEQITHPGTILEKHLVLSLTPNEARQLVAQTQSALQ